VLNVALILFGIAAVYHLAGLFGLILLAIAAVLFLARASANRARQHNPAPQPPNTHGRRQ
jgi:hypothetical protein